MVTGTQQAPRSGVAPTGQQAPTGTSEVSQAASRNLNITDLPRLAQITQILTPQISRSFHRSSTDDRVVYTDPMPTPRQHYSPVNTVLPPQIIEVDPFQAESTRVQVKPPRPQEDPSRPQAQAESSRLVPNVGALQWGPDDLVRNAEALLGGAINFFQRHIRTRVETVLERGGVFNEDRYHSEKDIPEVYSEGIDDCSAWHVSKFILLLLQEGNVSISSWLVSLIYLSRYRNATHIVLHPRTWRPLVITALIAAVSMS